jgi:pSer/pThr/pTyr-binding forkhead associated (FHA) protein
MNYALQIVRGRAESSTIKLMNGVNSIGRHDDCLIRIRSSQVSRRHCELYEDGGSLLVRDLGSANGTYVNGKRVLGQQRLSVGDVITIGGVTLRVEQLEAAARPSGAQPGAPKSGDTAELQAIPDDEEILEFEDEEFEVAIEEQPEHLDLIPLDDEPPPQEPQSKPSKPAPSASEAAKAPTPMEVSAKPPTTEHSADEDAAVAQFLMDLKLDEDE